MAGINRADIEAQLKSYIDPYTKEDLLTSKSIKSIDIDGRSVSVKIVLGYPADGLKAAMTETLKTKITALAEVDTAFIDIDFKVISHTVQKNLKPMAGVKNIIAVASGKGGVGKSTTSANLALALSREGARVGLLDADIYGPSIPKMLGLSGKADSHDGKSIEPKIAYDVQCMSVGFMVDEETPLILRGPMVVGALQQLLNETNWDDLDYLIIDLPPGTGDIQLTLSQQVPVSGSVIVTTPQDIALLDAQKALKMFERVEIPVLGVIENMSIHICSNCGHEESIFGKGGGALMAEKYDVELLGALPLDISIREDADGGKPSVAADPDGQVAAIYREIARKITAKLALKSKDFSGLFPNIVIENN
jgi:ATP-binding protein involved in chromosome partitioning